MRQRVRGSLSKIVKQIPADFLPVRSGCRRSVAPNAADHERASETRYCADGDPYDVRQSHGRHSAVIEVSPPGRLALVRFLLRKRHVRLAFCLIALRRCRGLTRLARPAWLIEIAIARRFSRSARSTFVFHRSVPFFSRLRDPRGIACANVPASSLVGVEGETATRLRLQSIAGSLRAVRHLRTPFSGEPRESATCSLPFEVIRLCERQREARVSHGREFVASSQANVDQPG
jgi:hypothetical protein